MTTERNFSVAIIGGGFCGVMTLIQLSRKVKHPFSIAFINSGYTHARGIAYSTYTNEHVLNVQAQNMSAFPDVPGHFVDWCIKTGKASASDEQLPFRYLPRNWYGEYIEEIFRETICNLPSNIALELINETAVDIDPSESGVSIKLASGETIFAEKTVIATGNHLPGHPPIPNKDFFKSKFYFPNPWNENTVKGAVNDSSVLIIGTGLTMVDVVLGLNENNFSGKIYALSPKGFEILPHRKHHQQRYILDELSPPYELRSLFKLFYKHVRNARKNGESGETVVDAVRSKTQEIWQHLSLEDKKSFMSHVRHLWGVARHRLPGEIHERISDMIRRGKLEVVAARIADIQMNGEKVTVQIKPRSEDCTREIIVSRVINCTGPQTDITKFESELFKNAIRKNIIRPDEMKLGIDATADGRINTPDPALQGRLFTLGSLLKGMLWESTAVPELRVQAEKVADVLSQ